MTTSASVRPAMSGCLTAGKVTRSRPKGRIM